MEKARRTYIDTLRAVILVFLGMSVPSMTFGERLSPVRVEEEAMKIELLPKRIKKGVVSFPSGFTGLRSEESEVEHTADHLLPQQGPLSTENHALVETTDASGGTMINLQGKFQCGLKVPQESMDIHIEKSFSPTIP